MKINYIKMDAFEEKTFDTNLLSENAINAISNITYGDYINNHKKYDANVKPELDQKFCISYIEWIAKNNPDMLIKILPKMLKCRISVNLIDWL